MARATEGVRHALAALMPSFDDLGYGDIGPFGSKQNRTPHLDAMAKAGMLLTSLYAAPLCTPSRAALMTGCYPKRVGLHQGSWHGVLMPGDAHALHPDEVTIAEVLKTNGYTTACIGKWHLGDKRRRGSQVAKKGEEVGHGSPIVTSRGPQRKSCLGGAIEFSDPTGPPESGAVRHLCLQERQPYPECTVRHAEVLQRLPEWRTLWIQSPSPRDRSSSQMGLQNRT